MQYAFAQASSYRAIDQRDRLAVGEFEGANIKRVGATVLGQSTADHAVAAAAFEGVEIVEVADDTAEVRRQRRYVGADPRRDGRRHRATEDRCGLDRNPTPVR